MLNLCRVGLATALLALALAGSRPVQAEMRVHKVSQSQSQGQAGAFPKLHLSPQWGLAISFIKTGEQIQQVRIGDPSRIVTDFDTPLEGARGAGASVIYLRQLAQPLDLDLRLPGAARHSHHVPLSVITQSHQGLTLYQFQLSLGEATQHSAVEVVPDALMPRPNHLPLRIELPRTVNPGEWPLPPLENTSAPVQLKPWSRTADSILQRP